MYSAGAGTRVDAGGDIRGEVTKGSDIDAVDAET